MAVKKKVGQVKYIASGVDDSQRGSAGRVLRNKLVIVKVREMEDAELEGYIDAEVALRKEISAEHRFVNADIDRIHELFLGKIYDWAGRYRDVNLTKGGFTFATARYIPQLMPNFERDVLSKHTPCVGKNVEEVARSVAVVHVEFLLIHPYREGNGRTARLLASLMAYQAGLPGLDFSFIGSRGKEFENYVAAIQAGVDNNYRPMTAIMKRAIDRALKNAHKT